MGGNEELAMRFPRVIILIFSAFIIFPLTGCRYSEDKISTTVTENNKSGLSQELKITVKSSSTDNKQSNKLELDRNDIKQISISCSLPLFKAFDVSDEGQISDVFDYLTSLDSFETNLDPKDYMGMGYSIKVRLKNGTERLFRLYGNKFFIESGGFTDEIPYEEACKFDTIVANLLESNQTKNGESSVTGTVISIEAEKSGRNTSCVIKVGKNSKYVVDLKDASIIDSTGNGWMILHEKDVIKVFYDKSKCSDDSSITASTVYIKEAAG